MTDKQEKNKNAVIRYNKEFIEAGNTAVFEETIAQDFINHSAHEGMSNDRGGVEYFFNKVLRPAFPDLEVTIDDQVAEGDKVVTRKSYAGTHRGPFLGSQATGKAVRWNVIDIVTLRDGQYTEHWACADMLGLRRQLESP